MAPLAAAEGRPVCPLQHISCWQPVVSVRALREQGERVPWTGSPVGGQGARCSPPGGSASHAKEKLIRGEGTWSSRGGSDFRVQKRQMPFFFRELCWLRWRGGWWWNFHTTPPCPQPTAPRCSYASENMLIKGRGYSSMQIYQILLFYYSPL